MPKTLLVDTNRAAFPAYQALVDWGHEVWVIGGRPDEPLAGICPNYVQLDYSDLSKLKEFIAEHQFDHIVPGCTDLSYDVCSKIGEGKLPGIDAHEVTKAINEKNEFRELSNEIGLSVPRVFSRDKEITVPSVIVKPVDSFSGRGMTILHDYSSKDIEDAVTKAEQASATGTCLIEEFVTGQLYSHSAFISNGEIVADFIVREDCIANSFTVDTSRVENSFPDSVKDRIRTEITKLSGHLKLVDGLVHTQFISDGDSYWMIEMTRRCPGDLYAMLIEMSTGYRYGAAYAAPFIGEKAPAYHGSQASRRIIRHTATSPHGESYWGFQWKRKINLPLFVSLAKSGEFIKESPFGRAALFFLEADTDEEMTELYEQLLKRELYSLQ